MSPNWLPKYFIGVVTLTDISGCRLLKTTLPARLFALALFVYHIICVVGPFRLAPKLFTDAVFTNVQVALGPSILFDTTVNDIGTEYLLHMS